MRYWMYVLRNWIIKFLLFFSIYACQPNTPEEFRSEGVSLMRSIYKDLKQVQSKKDLIKKRKKLIKKFHHLCNLVMQIHERKKKYPELFFIQMLPPPESSQLEKEIKRVCSIEGNKELLESYQKSAMKKLKVLHGIE